MILGETAKQPILQTVTGSEQAVYVTVEVSLIKS